MLFLSILIPFHLCVCTPIKNGAAGTCQQCSKDETRCVLCNQPADPNKLTYMPNAAGECIQYCNAVEDGPEGTCSKCILNTQTTRCEICNKNYFPDQHGICREKCTDFEGTFAGTCSKCYIENNRCLVCNDNDLHVHKYFPNKQGNCLRDCQEVEDGPEGTCAKCSDNKCINCFPNYVTDSNGKCSPCPAGSIYSQKEQKCVNHCSLDDDYGQCKSCSDDEPDKCGSCNENSHLKDGKCITNIRATITGEPLIGSVITANVIPSEAEKYVSYKWKINSEIIFGEVDKTLMLKNTFFKQKISVEVSVNVDNPLFEGNYEANFDFIMGKSCFPIVEQCSSCDMDQITCLECKIGHSVDECKSCSETDRGKCSECNGNAIINEEGKFIPTYKVDIIGQAVIGSKLFAEIDPPEAANFVSYQWNADGKSIIGETTRILIIKKEYFGKMISVNIIGDPDSSYPGNIEINSSSKVEGKECLPNVLQCSACDLDQTTCIGCKIGQGIDECKSCSETDRGKCSECNESATINEEGKCISKIEVEIIGEAVVGSVLTAQIYPHELTNYSSYRWNADDEPITNETMPTLLLKKSHFNKTISVDVQNPLSRGLSSAELMTIVNGTACSSDVLQCKSCDSDNQTCLECLAGSKIDEYAMCSINETSKCGWCNGNATLIIGKCLQKIEVAILGKVVIGSKLNAQVYPLSATNFVTYQ